MCFGAAGAGRRTWLTLHNQAAKNASDASSQALHVKALLRLCVPVLRCDFIRPFYCCGHSAQAYLRPRPCSLWACIRCFCATPSQFWLRMARFCWGCGFGWRMWVPVAERTAAGITRVLPIASVVATVLRISRISFRQVVVRVVLLQFSVEGVVAVVVAAPAAALMATLHRRATCWRWMPQAYLLPVAVARRAAA